MMGVDGNWKQLGDIAAAAGVAWPSDLARLGDATEPVARAAEMDDRPVPPDAAYENEFIDQSGSTRVSQFYSAASLKGRPVPPREWLVPDWIPRNTVTLFGGDGGSGKSLLALQLAIAAVTGAGWMGKAVTPCTAIFLTAEDEEDELHRRTDDILKAYGQDYDDLPKLTLRSLAGEDALLAVDSQLALIQSQLFKELEARAETDKPGLIVIDTLADVYPANENDRAKVRQFVGMLRGLSLRQRCAVVLLGHPSLTGMASGSGASGSTAWNNSVRSRLYLSRIMQDGYEPEPDKRVLTAKKLNYGRAGSEIPMTWRAGVFEAEKQPDGLDRLAMGAKAERVFLKLLRRFSEDGQTVNHSGGTNYAPKVFAEQPDNEGVQKTAFKVAMNSLLARKGIRIVASGPPSRRVCHLEGAQE